jgi:hypothetical protein
MLRAIPSFWANGASSLRPTRRVPSPTLYLFGDKYLFSILPNQQRARSDFCLISYVVNYGRVGKYIMRKSKRYVKTDGFFISPFFRFFFFFLLTKKTRGGGS